MARSARVGAVSGAKTGAASCATAGAPVVAASSSSGISAQMAFLAPLRHSKCRRVPPPPGTV